MGARIRLLKMIVGAVCITSLNAFAEKLYLCYFMLRYVMLHRGWTGPWCDFIEIWLYHQSQPVGNHKKIPTLTILFSIYNMCIGMNQIEILFFVSSKIAYLRVIDFEDIYHIYKYTS